MDNMSLSVSGILKGNRLILIGQSKEELDYNKKLELLGQILDIQNEHAAEINDIYFLETMKKKVTEEVNTAMAVEKFKTDMLQSQLKEITMRKQELEDILIHNNTISAKGIDGELFVEEYIRDKIRLNEEWDISNISKDKNHNSDLELTYKSIKCVIEVKNIKAKLSESNIRKFKEVYINSIEKEYTSGMFVSLLSDFSIGTNVYDFCIQSVNNKHVIYLARVKENPEKLIFAMEVLDQLNKINTRVDNKMFIEMLNKQVKNYSNLYSEVNRSLAAIKDMKTAIKDYQCEIVKFIADFGSDK
jgi:hypothetical protein